MLGKIIFYWQSQDKKNLKKINKLLKDISRNPFEGIGKPEPLKENLTGFGVGELMKNIDLFTLSKMREL